MDLDTFATLLPYAIFLGAWVIIFGFLGHALLRDTRAPAPTQWRHEYFHWIPTPDYIATNEKPHHAATTNVDMTEALNYYAREGWEVCEFLPEDNNVYPSIVFERDVEVTNA